MKRSSNDNHGFIGTQHSLFYELRPFILILVGLVGLFNHTVTAGGPVAHTSHICGLILLFAAAKIIHWRKVYRKSWF